MASTELKENGYDPDCVTFTNEILKPIKYNINHWVMSSDKQILHFGPILNSEDQKEIKLEAEVRAEKFSGIKKEALAELPEENKEAWINKYLNNMPQGWYLSDHKYRTVIAQTVSLSKLFAKKG